VSYFCLIEISCIGHKRIYSYSWILTTAPDGSIVDVYGPRAGRHVDSRLQRESFINARLMLAQAGRPVAAMFHTGTDKGFFVDVAVRPMHNNLVNTVQQTIENRDFASLRITNEHDIGRKSSFFQYIDASRLHNPKKQPLGVFYIVVCIMTNALNCLDAAGTCKYYQCDPPSLEAYFV
jgi:hypothetical protein